MISILLNQSFNLINTVIRCEKSSQEFSEQMEPTCEIKHARRSCLSKDGCHRCFSSEQSEYCRACRLSRVIQCVDIDKFYSRKYQKKSADSVVGVQQPM